MFFVFIVCFSAFIHHYFYIWVPSHLQTCLLTQAETEM